MYSSSPPTKLNIGGNLREKETTKKIGLSEKEKSLHVHFMQVKFDALFNAIVTQVNVLYM